MSQSVPEWISLDDLIGTKIDRKACEDIQKVMELDAFGIGGKDGMLCAVAVKGGHAVTIGPFTRDEFKKIDKFMMICHVASGLTEKMKETK